MLVAVVAVQPPLLPVTEYDLSPYLVLPLSSVWPIVWPSSSWQLKFRDPSLLFVMVCVPTAAVAVLAATTAAAATVFILSSLIELSITLSKRMFTQKLNDDEFQKNSQTTH